MDYNLQSWTLVITGRDYIPPLLQNSHIFKINSMLNHIALLKPRSLNFMLCLADGTLPKVVSALFTTLNCRRGWGGGGGGGWGGGEG